MRSLLSVLVVASSILAADDPRLVIQGRLHADGDGTLHVFGEAGDAALLALGLDPLITPVPTAKGPFHIGQLVDVIGLGSVPAGGRLDIPFVLPPYSAAVADIPIVLQGLAGAALTNPATLELDAPYFTPADSITLTAPVPSTQALFGDRVAIGDLDGDGHADIAVGAWFETVGGEFAAGRAYVFFGPDYGTVLTLDPPEAVFALGFGAAVEIADFTGDGLDDLVVTHTTGTPAVTTARLLLYEGAADFDATPSLVVPVGTEFFPYVNFGRFGTVADVDADGRADLVVGLPDAPVGSVFRAGRIEIYHGPDFQVVTTIENPTPTTDSFFGEAVAVGDVTGDGIVDLVEGSGRDESPGFTNDGVVHVFDGPTWTHRATIASPDAESFASFGKAVELADLDSDGVDEMFVANDLKVIRLYDSNPLFVSNELVAPPTNGGSSFGETLFADTLESVDINGDGVIDIVTADYAASSVSCGGIGPGFVYGALGPFFSSSHVVEGAGSECLGGFGRDFVVQTLEHGAVLLVVGSHSADVGVSANGGVVYVFTGDQ